MKIHEREIGNTEGLNKEKIHGSKDKIYRKQKIDKIIQQNQIEPAKKKENTKNQNRRQRESK